MHPVNNKSCMSSLRFISLRKLLIQERQDVKTAEKEDKVGLFPCEDVTKCRL